MTETFEGVTGGAMVPGARGRLGVIQPAPGLMLEAEWAEAVPKGVAFPVTRLALHGSTSADYDDMAARAPEAAAVLANAGADVIGYACGLGSLHRGPAAERSLMDRLREAAGGIEVIGMAEAALAEMRRLRASRISLLTPYPAALNALVQAYVKAAGFTVTAVVSLPAPNAVAAAGLLPDQVLEAALPATEAGTDLVWIPCSNVRAIGLGARLRERTGCPCLSSNEALLAVMLSRLPAMRAQP